MSRGARRSAAVAALLGALVAAAPAAAQTTQSQRFFKARLLADPRTSSEVRQLLRDGGGFVDGSVVFRDLTRDKRDDAIVRVHSGGAAGVVAVYVFSTDARGTGSPLRAIYRDQRVLRGATAVSRGVLSYSSSDYVAGDELCCPSRVTETTLRWDRSRMRFAAERKTVDQAPQTMPLDGPSGTPPQSGV